MLAAREGHRRNRSERSVETKEFHARDRRACRAVTAGDEHRAVGERRGGGVRACLRQCARRRSPSAARRSLKQSAVQDILWDMEQTLYLQDSAYLAADVQERLVNTADGMLKKENRSGWKNRGVRQAPFYVLSHAAMPAILVEFGYLSNARDRKLMTEKIFQENLAKGLAEGVKKYRESCHFSH